MRLLSLYLRDFRNYEELALSFAPGVNFLYGENGAGKTNILEAISLLITGRSFRTRHLHELIRFGSDRFYIEGRFEKNGVEQLLKMQLTERKRTIIHNQTPLPTLSALFGLLQGTLLTPDDYQLIAGSPKKRRHFLDLQISQTHPLYLFHLSRYHKAMKQRNAVLKKKQKETLSIWEEEMAESALHIVQYREEATHELATYLEEGVLHYLPSCSGPLAPLLAKNRERDALLGMTTMGPHKDDLSIALFERSARSFASEGQKRLLVARLRFAEWQRLYRLCEESPLLLIDDVGLSFDLKKEESFLLALKEFGQVFVTSARFNEALSQETHLVEVCGNGKVQTPCLR